MKTALAAIVLTLAALPALAQNVKITPIGSHPGELCANDRAIIFEESAAHAINELIRPASVIVTHVNEPGTEGGKLRPISRTAALIKQLKPPAHLAISGRTMEFDGSGRCVAGC
jgi:hypothetical protein